MSYTLLKLTARRARKRHTCIWCGEAILRGEEYRDERSVFDGHMQNHKWHTDCYYGADFSDGPEFNAYENERCQRVETVDPAGVST